jgi:hypothetical protein
MKIPAWKSILLIGFFLFIFPFWSGAQVAIVKVQPPEIQDFAPVLQFLASPGLEGRETGTQGCNIAANYIASRMQSMGLKPFKQVTDEKKIILSDYFQSFNLLRYNVSGASVSIRSQKNKQQPIQLLHEKDFTVENIFQDFSLETNMVFAGYGINSHELKYNDYAGLEVKGKLVVVFDGYPGQRDTLSVAWKKFMVLAENDGYDLDLRCTEAARQGAVAIVVIHKEYMQPAGKAAEEEPIYRDSEYLLPAGKQEQAIPCILLTAEGSRLLSEVLKINFRDIKQEYAQHLNCSPVVNKYLFRINLQVDVDTLIVQNVIGVLPGLDTTKTVILGAHYDHLGKRGNDIYYGADDNASGVAGLLALAGRWTESLTVPPCNIIFASWTAEEKGLIGSEYFVSTLSAPEKVKLYINMDMISRSVSEDTAGRQLSIGTRAEDEFIREIARESNLALARPFELDLWDVTGHSGSDYASFTAKNIPIMTYNSGLHNDYHTPRDISANADLVKMGDVLRVVNSSLKEILQNMIGK